MEEKKRDSNKEERGGCQCSRSLWSILRPQTLMYINGAAIWQWWHKACLQGAGWLQPGWSCLACEAAGIYHAAPMLEAAQLNTATQLSVQCIYIFLFLFRHLADTLMQSNLQCERDLKKRNTHSRIHTKRLQADWLQDVKGQGLRGLIIPLHQTEKSLRENHSEKLNLLICGI